MSVYETMGFFWTVICTGLVTAGVLIAAIYCMVIGAKVILARYRMGKQASEEIATEMEVRTIIRIDPTGKEKLRS